MLAGDEKINRYATPEVRVIVDGSVMPIQVYEVLENGAVSVPDPRDAPLLTLFIS